MAAHDAQRRRPDVHRGRRLGRSGEVHREVAKRRSAGLRLTGEALPSERQALGVLEARRALLDGADAPPRALLDGAGAPPRAMDHRALRGVVLRRVTGYRRAIEVLVQA